MQQEDSTRGGARYLLRPWAQYLLSPRYDSELASYRSIFLYSV